jgi:lipoprotein-releasing system ATP-binding protein
MTEVISAKGLHKAYREGDLAVEVLKGADLDVMRGEVIAIVGASGSGKSTLLHCLGGLDTVDAGTVKIGGRDVAGLGERERGDLRNRALGFVYQFHHLLPEFTALDNVAMPLSIRRLTLAQSRAEAAGALQAVGLGARLQHHPAELSGGERQRTAIARAIVTQPACVLADEPTGNLDRKTGQDIMQILRRLNTRQNLTIVMVTHDQSIAEQADNIVRLVEGRVEDA